MVIHMTTFLDVEHDCVENVPQFKHHLWREASCMLYITPYFKMMALGLDDAELSMLLSLLEDVDASSGLPLVLFGVQSRLVLLWNSLEQTHSVDRPISLVSFDDLQTMKNVLIFQQPDYCNPYGYNFGNNFGYGCSYDFKPGISAMENMQVR